MIDYGWAILWRLLKKREYPGFENYIDELRQESSFTPEKWQNCQNKKLNTLLRFAVQNVPFYIDQYDLALRDCDLDSLHTCLHNLPILTKKTIQDNIDALISKTISRSSLIENSTGGSTGVPLKFYQDHRYKTIAIALEAYVRGWYGIQPFDKTAQIWGADREFYEMSGKEKIYEKLQRVKALNAFRMTEESLDQFCQMLVDWDPPYLMGYATALEALARYASKDSSREYSSLKAIRSTAETLYPHQRKLIENVFGTQVFNFYGSREVNNIAAECPEEKRLHLISTWRHVEIVDGAGSPVPLGTPGYIAVTDLSNYAMPFIRYRNEDIACLSKEACPCGRPSPVIEQLLGRSTDLIITPSREIVHGEFFTHLFYGCDDIRQFQVHQKTLSHIIIRYVSDGEDLGDFMEGVKKKIMSKTGSDLNITIERCDHIPVPKSGKHRFTISDVAPF
ncbi:MAG: phenylacetate--CoA ligase family protein [Thermodesulfobacteriota bacterium]